MASVSVTLSSQSVIYKILKEGCCDLPVNLLSKYTMTISPSLSQLILFSYSSVSSESSIYYFDINTLLIVDTLINKDNLLTFSGYFIQTIQFPFDNDFFYYFITYNSNQYLGSGYIGSNSKLLQYTKTNVMNVFFSYSGNRIVYILNDKSVTKSDCPFIWTTTQTCEVNSCKSLGLSYAIRSANNLFSCQECKSPEFVFSEMCLNKCPSKYGIDDTSNSCFLCKSRNLFYLQTSDKCLSSCPNLFGPDKNNVCTYCISIGKVFYNNNCIDKCPIGYVSDPNTGSCTSCTSNGKVYLPDGTCGTTCGTYMLPDLCI